ncbi:MAG TPA: hypothetical protein VGS57_08540 [Thermoanaerobaculia bacterium]|jgi:hypothetical protein|nr:hypothetical protein [Thermoanaerobaculia bacterium]
MLQMFGQMMMMPLSMATTGVNMMTGSLAGGRGDGRAGWNASLGRWLGGCCGSREGPNVGGGGTARLGSGAAGWTAREGKSGGTGTSNPIAGGYRSGTEQRQPVTGYRSGTDSRPSVDYRSGTESRPSVDYRSGTDARPSGEGGSRSESRAGGGRRSRSDSAWDSVFGAGRRNGGGGNRSSGSSGYSRGSEDTRTNDRYREERRMSDCGCCDDSDNRNLKLVEYWVVNVKYCDDPERSAFLGHDYQAYTEVFGDCDLDTWLLGTWVRRHPHLVPPGDEKYLRIKVNRIGDWHTVEDCCPRPVDVLRRIDETLRQGLLGLPGGGGGGHQGGGAGGYQGGRGGGYTPSGGPGTYSPEQSGAQSAAG